MTIVFDLGTDFSPSVWSPLILAKSTSEATVSNVFVIFSAGKIAALITSLLVADRSFVPASASAGTSPASLPPHGADSVAIFSRFANVVDVQSAVLVLTAFELVWSNAASSRSTKLASSGKSMETVKGTTGAPLCYISGCQRTREEKLWYTTVDDILSLTSSADVIVGCLLIVAMSATFQLLSWRFFLWRLCFSSGSCRGSGRRCGGCSLHWSLGCFLPFSSFASSVLAFTTSLWRFLSRRSCGIWRRRLWGSWCSVTISSGLFTLASLAASVFTLSSSFLFSSAHENAGSHCIQSVMIIHSPIWSSFS